MRTLEYHKRRNFWRIKSVGGRLEDGDIRSFTESMASMRIEYADDKEYGNDKVEQLSRLTHET